MYETLTRNPKVPPKAVDIERLVIGAMLIDSGTLDLIDKIPGPEMFYHPQNKFVYLAISELYRKSQPVDMLTVIEKLREIKKLEDAGGEAYIVELVNTIASGAHAEYHIYILLQKYILRKVIGISAKATAINK